MKIQEQALAEKARLQNITIDTTISDIGNGMNYKKRGFKQLMNMLLTNKIKHLVIMQKDRLLRFGSEITFVICKFFNVQVTILEPSPANSPTEQLCMDLVEIMTVFTNKIYGMRSNSNKKVLVQAVNMAMLNFDQLIRILLKTPASILIIATTPSVSKSVKPTKFFGLILTHHNSTECEGCQLLIIWTCALKCR